MSERNADGQTREEALEQMRLRQAEDLFSRRSSFASREEDGKRFRERIERFRREAQEYRRAESPR